jgi:uncharacterized membrane protein
MKTSVKWDFKSISGKIMMGLVLAAMTISVGVTPANAGHRGGHGGGHGGHRAGSVNRGHGGGYGNGRWYGHGGYYGGGGYGYIGPDYVAPPPVYYAPEPAPGVSIFLPAIHIR